MLWGILWDPCIERGIRTARGGEWNAVQMQRMFQA
jgi:hypothetical protein